jgi:hypothetical protein
LTIAIVLAAATGGAAVDDGFTSAEFHAPPARCAPHVTWQWVGYNITKEGITKDLESMKNAGVGGAIIFQITSAGTSRFAPVANTYSPGVEYYNDKWFALLRHAAREASRLGLELGLHNCIGWSVSGGPWIKPENTMQRVVWTERRITGPHPYDKFLDQPACKLNYYKDIAVLLVPDGEPAPGRIINVTDKMRPDGRLTCDIPKGKYTIYRFGHTPTGAKPNAAPENRDALEADKMSARSMSLHMQNVLEPLKKHLGEYIGRSFKVIHFDSYEAGGQDWTPLMQEEFQARKGYDILPWLPVLAGRVIENRKSSEGFRRDLNAAISDMFLEYSFQLPKKMIHEAGLEMQNEPYATGPGNVARPFDTFDAARISDRPTTEFWFHRRRDELDIWQVNAAIPFFGKTILSAEAFSGRGEHSRWNETPARLKYSGNIAFSRGVNRMVLHHWVHQPFPDNIKPGMSMGPWGTHFGRNQTWYEPGKAWLAYLTRSQYLLQQGEKVSDFVSLGAYMPGGDVISEKTLYNHVSIKNGLITGPTERTYHLLVVPDKAALTLAALEKMEKLIAQGAVVLGPKPAAPAPCRDFASISKKFKKLADRIWGNDALPSTGEHAYGQGKVFWGCTPEHALRRLNIAPSIKFLDTGNADDDICWQHRTAGNAEIFYFSKIGEKPGHLNLSLRAKNKTPEIWNPETGEIAPVAVWRPTDTGTDISLSLKPNQALFVVFREPVSRQDFIAAVDCSASRDCYSVEQNAGNAGWTVKSATPGNYIVRTTRGEILRATVGDLPAAVSFDGAWTVEFKPPGGDTFSTTFAKLESWTLSRDERIKYFSGTAVYTNTFQVDRDNISDSLSAVLDLGTVKELASVTINGKFVTTLWHAPFETDITNYIKHGKNEIRIAVTNTWANRLIGDNQYPGDCEWGVGTPAEGRPLLKFPDWLLENKPRPSGRRQAFSTWNYFDTPQKSVLLDSALLGRVRLKFLRRAAFAEQTP